MTLKIHPLLLLFAGMVLLVPPVHISTAPSSAGPSRALPIFDVGGPTQLSHYVGSMPSTKDIILTVALKYNDSPGLQAFLSDVKDPRSPTYHHYLTQAEFNARFSPSPSTVGAVRGYFLSHGAISVTSDPGGLLLTVTMRANTVENLFHIGLGYFADGSVSYYGALGTPTLPPPLSPYVSAVDGLTNEPNAFFSTAGSLSLTKTVVAPSKSPANFDVVKQNGLDIYWGTDYQAVYDELPLIQSGYNGNGFAIATILTSGFNSTANGGRGEDLPPFDPAALRVYFGASFPSGATLPQATGVPVTAGGKTPPAPGAPPTVGGNDLTDDSGSVAENSLDLEMAGSMAPGAALYTFYFSQSLISQSLSNAAGYFDTTLDRALAYNYGAQRLAAISNSWGLMDTNDSIWDGLETKAAALGVTLIASSGDQGNAPSSVQSHPQGQWPSFPATATFNSYGVIAVGGTEVSVTGSSTGSWDPNSNAAPPPGYDAPNITGISSESAWYSPTSKVDTFGGTEGGVSLYVNEPVWQAESAAQPSIKYAASKECGVSYGRGVPDVGLSGYATIVFFSEKTVGSQIYVGMGIFDGTSVSSPLVAGLVAVTADRLGAPLGFLDPEIYAINSYFAKNPGSLDPFRSITIGKNYVFNASTGWDALTGWGSPDAVKLVSALQNGLYTGFIYNSAATPGKAYGAQPASCSGGGSSNTNTNPAYFFVILVIAVAMIVAVVISVVLSSRKRPPPPPPSPPGQAPGQQPYNFPTPQTVVCGFCHRPFPEQWGFCPYCGTWIRR